MARRPDLPCASCGTLMWSGSSSLPEGQARCRPCRRARRDGQRRGSGLPQTHTCAACGRQWTRTSTRGQVPKYCPGCSGHYRTYTCDTCGEYKLLPAGTYRCLDCRQARERARIERILPIQYDGPRHRPRITTHVRTARRLTSGRCRVCDEWFVSEHLDVTCSIECSIIRQREMKRIGRDRRRSRKVNAYRADVHRKRVYEADGYRCHLCGKKTDKRKVVPHPKAPTVDHIVPLASGGTHEPSNCRTACFMCNATKGSRGGGEQLLIAL